MTSEKRTSGKAVVECRFNPVQRRWRCHIAVGKKRVGPLFVRVSEEIDNEAEAIDEAARLALSRALSRHLVDRADIEHEHGEPVVHGEGSARRPRAGRKMKAKAHAARQLGGAARKAPSTKAKGPTAKPIATAPRKAPTAAKPPTARKSGRKPAASSIHAEKAHKIVGNGKETRALEDLYEEVKNEYHEVGDALKERHLVMAALGTG